MPTGPGWWWRMGPRGPYVEEVDGDQNHAPWIAIEGMPVKDDGSWLAPIPGPAVCAALAEAGVCRWTRRSGWEAAWLHGCDGWTLQGDPPMKPPVLCPSCGKVVEVARG